MKEKKCTDAIFAPRSLLILYEKLERGLGLVTDNRNANKSSVNKTEVLFCFFFIFIHKRNLLRGSPELVIVTHQWSLETQDSPVFFFHCS